MPYEMPAVCVSRSRMVMARRAGTMARPVSVRTSTVARANDGRNRLTGVVSDSLPSSSSMSTAVLVIALVCDAKRKMASVDIGRCASRSFHPTARSYTTRSSRSTNATAPPISFAATAPLSIVSRRASRSRENPWRVAGSVALAVGGVACAGSDAGPSTGASTSAAASSARTRGWRGRGRHTTSIMRIPVGVDRNTRLPKPCGLGEAMPCDCHGLPRFCCRRCGWAPAPPVRPLRRHRCRRHHQRHRRWRSRCRR